MNGKKGMLAKGWFRVSFIVILFVSLAGCVSVKPLALTGETKELNLEKESIAVFSLETSNHYKSNYQPGVSFVTVVGKNSNGEKETYRFGNMATSLEPCAMAENQFNRYLISMNLPAGKYRITYAQGFSGVFPVRGSFWIPVFSDFEIGPNKIAYLGRIEAILRERKNDSELRGGPVIPLLDQAVTGFWSGTFDITMSDKFEEDSSVLKQKFPLLNQVVMEKAVLGPWKKPSKEEMNY